MDQFLIEMACPTLAPQPAWGSMMHGMLMERLPEEWQALLHTDQSRPLSQWVEVKSPVQLVWHIGVTADTLGDRIDSLLKTGDVWRCEHLKADMTVTGFQHHRITAAEYLKRFFLAEKPCPGVYLTFMTPTTHKSQGRYVVFPSVDLIARNLNAHFCAMAPDFALSDATALDQVIAHTYIARYRLESMRYYLEGAVVSGYTGRLQLRFNGPDPLKRLAGVLFSFAEYSGVGIKTALGMGGCTVAPLVLKGEQF